MKKTHVSQSKRTASYWALATKYSTESLERSLAKKMQTRATGSYRIKLLCFSGALAAAV
jgi:hypothetical protein